jgi:hypothetical protein
VCELPNADTLRISSRIRSRVRSRIARPIRFQILSFLPRHVSQNTASEPPLRYLAIAQSNCVRRSMVHLIQDSQAFFALLSLWALFAPAESLPSPVSAIAGPTTQAARLEDRDINSICGFWLDSAGASTANAPWVLCVGIYILFANALFSMVVVVQLWRTLRNRHLRYAEPCLLFTGSFNTLHLLV